MQEWTEQPHEERVDIDGGDREGQEQLHLGGFVRRVRGRNGGGFGSNGGGYGPGGFG
jgi:hypothetical protein